MLLLDEEAFKKLSDEKQVLLLLQWLHKLPQTIRNTSKAGTPYRRGAFLRIHLNISYPGSRDRAGGVEAESETAGGSVAATVAVLARPSNPLLSRASLRRPLPGGGHLPPRDSREMLRCRQDEGGCSCRPL